MSTRLLSVALSVLFLFGATACDRDKDISGPVFTDGLNLIIQNEFVSAPAKVSVFFKVETSEGEPVAGLTDGNFTISENEKLISADEAARQISPRRQQFAYSTLLILDLSASVTNNNLPRLKEAAKLFVTSVIPEDNDGSINIGINWFDGEDKLHQLHDFSSDVNSLLTAIDGVNPDISQDNSTDLYGAVIKGVSRINSIFWEYQNDDLISAASIVVFTDGTDQAARYTQERALESVSTASDQISFYSIGLGSEIDENVLRSIGNNGFAFAENTNQLIETFERIAGIVSRDANSYYLFEYCSPKRNGQHNVTISATYENLRGSVTTKFDANDFGGGCSL
ncbi:MAG: VWA domain-containing protein [Bacteroidota bacterium]